MPVDKKNGARPAITARRPVFLWLCLLLASRGSTAFPMRRSYRKIRLHRFASRLLPLAVGRKSLLHCALGEFFNSRP